MHGLGVADGYLEERRKKMSSFALNSEFRV